MPFKVTTDGVSVEKDTWADTVDHLEAYYKTEEIRELFEEGNISIIKMKDVTLDAKVFFDVGPFKPEIDF